MYHAESFVRPHEQIAQTTPIADPDNPFGSVDFAIHELKREGLNEGDEVLLEIGKRSSESILIGRL